MRIAIIGASADRKKFGNIALRAWKDRGHEVFAVNPKETVIEGVKCYSSVLDIPGEIDAASFYVPPHVGIRVAGDVVKKGIRRVYLNPGAGSDEISDFLKGHGVEVLLVCSIRAIGADPASY